MKNLKKNGFHAKIAKKQKIKFYIIDKLQFINDTHIMAEHSIDIKV